MDTKWRATNGLPWQAIVRGTNVPARVIENWWHSCRLARVTHAAARFVARRCRGWHWAVIGNTRPLAAVFVSFVTGGNAPSWFQAS